MIQDPVAVFAPECAVTRMERLRGLLEPVYAYLGPADAVDPPDRPGPVDRRLAAEARDLSARVDPLIGAARPDGADLLARHEREGAVELSLNGP